jgi:hypothetical protein
LSPGDTLVRLGWLRRRFHSPDADIIVAVTDLFNDARAQGLRGGLSSTVLPTASAGASGAVAGLTGRTLRDEIGVRLSTRVVGCAARGGDGAVDVALVGSHDGAHRLPGRWRLDFNYVGR